MQIFQTFEGSGLLHLAIVKNLENTRLKPAWLVRFQLRMIAMTTCQISEEQRRDFLLIRDKM